jgi:branched-subunit amino acid ABC-type transport system permease component
MDFFLQNIVNALQWGSFYALIALGYSMVYSIMMLFNFAHGDIFMTGSYIGFGIATMLLALAASMGMAYARLADAGTDHRHLHDPDLFSGYSGGTRRLSPLA